MSTEPRQQTARLQTGLTLREMARLQLHRGNGRFINPFMQQRVGSPLDMVRWKLFTRNPYRASYVHEQVKPVAIDWNRVKKHDGLSISFIKHASVLIKDGGDAFLIDPIFYGLPGPFRDFTPLAFDIAAMPVPHSVLITHGHYDHLDLPTLKHFTHTSRLITPLGYRDIIRGAPRHTELDWYDSLTQGRREIIFLPANHWSMRNALKGPNTSLWGSYLIKTASGPIIYIAGDSAYFPHYADIGKEYPIDLAIFNLGAYAPRWLMGKAHMNPAEVFRSFTELKARQLMVVHWGTFRLGDEPVFLPPLDIRHVMENAGRGEELIHLEHGQTLFYT